MLLMKSIKGLINLCTTHLDASYEVYQRSYKPVYNQNLTRCRMSFEQICALKRGFWPINFWNNGVVTRKVSQGVIIVCTIVLIPRLLCFLRMLCWLMIYVNLYSGPFWALGPSVVPLFQFPQEINSCTPNFKK